MKHPLQIIYIITSILFSHSAFSQITLTEDDMPQIGDVIVRYIDTIPTYGPGNAGAGQMWDFSNAVSEDTATTTVLSTNATPFANTFSSSDYAMQGETDAYLYFEQTNSNVFTTGAAGDLLETGEIIEAPFTDPLILHVFPRTFGNFFNDTYEFQAEADGADFDVYRIRLTHNGHVYDTTDGYGTLITPTGTYDALRVKSTDFTTSVIEAQVSEFFPVWTPVTTIEDTTVSYSWHAKQEKMAIAEYSYDSIGNPKQFVYSSVPPVVTTDVLSEQSSSELFLYPQPSADRTCIQGLDLGAGPHRVELFSMDGKMIRQEWLQTNCLQVNDLPSGLYMMRIETRGRHAGALRLMKK